MKEEEENKKEDINAYESESEDDFNKIINNIDINKIFYKRIYHGLTENDKQLWENFYFPKAIYKIIYKKSRLKQKEILTYCVKYGMKYDWIGPNPQSPIPNPQSPIPNPHLKYFYYFIKILLFNFI